MFTPSTYQQAVFNFLLNTYKRHAIVRAVAGGGKTSTILEGLNRLIASGVDPASVLFITFNKNIATELADRVPEGVVAKTFNALGHGALYRGIEGKIKLDARKTWKILDALEDEGVLLDYESGLYGAGVTKLVDLARQVGMHVLTKDDDDSEWLHLIDHYDIQFNEKNGHEADAERAVELARIVLSRSIDMARSGVIDFSDQLYLPILWNLHFTPKAFVFVDEAQDVNKVQRAILRKCIGHDGRLIAVGDSKQAIYGFRGADVDAMDLIQSEFNAEMLPLSICYRCDAAVVELAKNVVPYIEARPGAAAGDVGTLDTYTESTFKRGEALLCRNNKPLVDFAYQLIIRGVGCAIRGRDIGYGLKCLVDKMKASSADDLVDRLRIYQEREMDRFMQEGKEDRAQSIEDKVESLLIIVDRATASSPADFIKAIGDEIDSLFTDKAGHGLVLLSSIHKAKGLEWDRVYFLDAALIPSKWARRDWQVEQEYNLYYVGVTRARRELFFIESNNWS